jgi:Uma2 family endonuclease
MDDPQVLTWDEFLDLPYETRNAALIDGKVVVNPPIARHETVVGNLIIAFKTWIRSDMRGIDGAVASPLLTGLEVKVGDLFER